MRRLRFHHGYLIVALLLAALTFAISLVAFPQWGRSWATLLALAVLVIGGAVSFLADLRAVAQVNTPPDSPPTSSVSIGDIVGQDKIGDHSVKAGDFIGSSGIAIGPHATSTTTITNIHQTGAEPPALSLHQLPPPPRDFTGREAELADLLTNIDRGVTISGLHGLGG